MNKKKRGPRRRKQALRVSHAVLKIPIPPEEEFTGMPDVEQSLRDAGHNNAADMYLQVKDKAIVTDVNAQDGMVTVNLSWYGPPYFDKPR